MKVSANLKHYVDGINLFAQMYANSKKLDYMPLNLGLKHDLKQVLDQIEGELSPENLTCDGELAPSAVRGKARRLHQLKAEVETLMKVAA